MPNWEPEAYARFIARRAQAGDTRTRPGAELQKQQDARAGKINNRSKKAKVDGSGHAQFRVSITLRNSDERRRDGDGAASTILDCLIRAVRRFRSVDTGNLRKSGTLRKG